MKRIAFVIVLIALLAACQPTSPVAQSGGAKPPLKVIATETFLADIAQNVAGDRLKIDALMPIGVDPHTFEPTPTDVARVADSNVLIVNGAGMEVFLDKLKERGRPEYGGTASNDRSGNRSDCATAARWRNRRFRSCGRSALLARSEQCDHICGEHA